MNRPSTINNIREIRSAIRDLRGEMQAEKEALPKTFQAIDDAYHGIVEAHETYIYESKGVKSDGE